MDNLSIVIVEDESLVALELSNTIKNLGYNVIDYATNVAMAQKLINESKPDLILMDINLRDTMDGIELYKSMNISTPIIYLTAYKDSQTIAKAVQTNPLGYLIKPHNEDELKALLQLCEYKIKNNQFQKETRESKITLGAGYFFDTKEQKLYFQKLYINLGSKELQLLKLLIAAHNQIVSFETIKNEIWGDQEISDSSLRTLIYRLRSKLEYKLIKTEFNLGIKLEKGDDND